MSYDRPQIQHALRHGIPVVVRTHLLPPETEAELEAILGLCLEELGRSLLLGRLAYCLKELTGNAKKANTKRVYFEAKGLRIDDPSDYEKGMKSFKAETLGDIRRYLALQESRNLTIEVSFTLEAGALRIAVKNSVPLSPFEEVRIRERLGRSWTIDSIDEIFGEVIDESEGAGLGLGILLLTLKKMGLEPSAFRLEGVGGDTVATLLLPMDDVRSERVRALSAEIALVVDSLPAFPENLRRMMTQLEDPAVTFADLASTLAQDPALAADLLKFFHSAATGARKVDTLEEAVRVVGLRALKDLLLPFGAHRVMERFLARQRGLWDDAVRVSFWAEALAQRQQAPREVRTLVSIAGLLHNLGRIVAAYVDPETSRCIAAFCKAKGFGPALYEDLVQTITSADLGGRITERWRFPSDLIEVIRCQDHPLEASLERRPAAFLLRGASCLRAVENQLMQYSQIEAPTLQALGFTGPGALAAWHQERR